MAAECPETLGGVRDSASTGADAHAYINRAKSTSARAAGAAKPMN